MADDNMVFTGNNKNVMSYVMPVTTQLDKGIDEVVLKASGGAISRAVDTAEITKNRFLTNMNIL